MEMQQNIIKQALVDPKSSLLRKRSKLHRVACLAQTQLQRR